VRSIKSCYERNNRPFFNEGQISYYNHKVSINVGDYEEIAFFRYIEKIVRNSNYRKNIKRIKRE